MLLRVPEITALSPYLVELDDVRVIEYFQNLNLAVDFVQVVIIETSFIDYFDGNLKYTEHVLTFTEEIVHGSVTSGSVEDLYRKCEIAPLSGN